MQYIYLKFAIRPVFGHMTKDDHICSMKRSLQRYLFLVASSAWGVVNGDTCPNLSVLRLRLTRCNRKSYRAAMAYVLLLCQKQETSLCHTNKNEKYVVPL